MERLVVKNGHEKDACYDKIGLCVHTLDIIIASIYNVVGMAYL